MTSFLFSLSPHRDSFFFNAHHWGTCNFIHFHLVKLFVVEIRIYSISAANKLNLYIFITIFSCCLLRSFETCSFIHFFFYFTLCFSLTRSFSRFYFPVSMFMWNFHFILFCFYISFFVSHCFLHFMCVFLFPGTDFCEILWVREKFPVFFSFRKWDFAISLSTSVYRRKKNASKNYKFVAREHNKPTKTSA